MYPGDLYESKINQFENDWIGFYMYPEKSFNELSKVLIEYKFCLIFIEFCKQGLWAKAIYKDHIVYLNEDFFINDEYSKNLSRIEL